MVERDHLVAERGRRSLISWGALFAGLVFVMGASWLLFLLGSAIGVSVADATDFGAMGDGLGIGAIIWIILTSLLTFCVGAYLTGRLSGQPDRQLGLWHGATLWGAGTLLLVVLTYSGVSGLLQAGGTLVGNITNAGQVVGSTVIGGGDEEGSLVEQARSAALITIQAQIKRQVRELLSQPQQIQSPQQPPPQQQTAQTDPQGRSIDTIVEQLQQPQTEESPPQATEPPQPTRPTVQEDVISQEEIDRIIEQLDADTLSQVALQLLQGNTEAAKDTLVVGTDLSEVQINAIIDGVSSEVQQTVDELQSQLQGYVETASNYAQWVIWVSFISSALGLAVALAGGWLGAGAIPRERLAVR